MRKLSLAALMTIMALVASACIGASGSERYIDAYLSRAVQIFPGNSVRVLGVEVGRVTEVENAPSRDAARVTMRIDDPDIVLPADVHATVVPQSLLGERYIQLLPAYDGGPRFTGDELTLDQTSVPVEQDELLRSLQDYFGELDPEKVEGFITQTARVLRGNGRELNRLIENGSSVISTLADKRDTLASLIVNFNEVTQTLATRKQNLARLINTYNSVASTLNTNRDALEGTIIGLNEAAQQLAALLVDHRDPLGKDIKALTRTSRTLKRNVHRLARTGKWADKLFSAASRAVDYKRDWLRLGNQGAPLFDLIEHRLRDRLVGVCLRLEIEDCAVPGFWAQRMPDLFCLPSSCPKAERNRTPGDRLNEALRDLPDDVGDEISDDLGSDNRAKKKRNCKEAKRPRICRLRKKLDPGQTLDDLLDELQGGLSEVLGLRGGLL